MNLKSNENLTHILANLALLTHIFAQVADLCVKRQHHIPLPRRIPWPRRVLRNGAEHCTTRIREMDDGNVAPENSSQQAQNHRGKDG